MLFAFLLLLCSTSDPLGSLVFCLFVLGGFPAFLCFVRRLDTSFCKEGVWARVLFFLVLLVVVVLALLLLSWLLVAPLAHLWWTHLDMLRFLRSLLSLSTLCQVLLSSLLSNRHRFCILCCHLLASPLFVSMLSVLWHLVHHLFVVECTRPFLVGHAHASNMDLLWSSSPVLDWLPLDVELLLGMAALWSLLDLLALPLWEASSRCVDTLVLVVDQLWIVEMLLMALWLVEVLVVVVCCLEVLFSASLWTMFLLSSCFLVWSSSVASCRGLDMLLRWPLCCSLVFVRLFFCSSRTFLLELDICCLAWTMPCVLSCGLLPKILGYWVSIGHSCCEGLPCLLVSVWLVLFLLLFLLLFGWLQPHVDWQCYQYNRQEVEAFSLLQCWVESLGVCVIVGVSLSCVVNPCSASLVTDMMGCVTSHT